MDVILLISLYTNGDRNIRVIEPYTEIDRTGAIYKVFKQLIFLSLLQFRLKVIYYVYIYNLLILLAYLVL